MKLNQLLALGFDQSSHIPFTKQFRVSCSQCASLVINGSPSHESNCPNEVRECHGCNALVERGVKYCADCR